MMSRIQQYPSKMDRGWYAVFGAFILSAVIVVGGVVTLINALA